MDTVGSNLPGNLIVDSGKLTKHHKDGFTIVSNVLMVKLQQNQQKRDLFDLGVINLTNKTVYVVVDFALANKNFKTAAMSSHYCVYFDREKRSWSTRGARLISYDSELNSVKCSYDQLGIYAVATSTNALTGSESVPVQFSLATIILMPFSFALMFIIAVCLLLIKQQGTPLIQIYFNLSLNILIMQMVFYFGINANASPIFCKLIAILQHYLHLSSYLWIFIIALHLYRMLTELRDINKCGSRLPVFYYVIALGIPGIIVSLTLGIKQDIYTNSSFFINLSDSNAPALQGTSSFTQFYFSSIYCWLCVTNYYEMFYVFLLPILVVIFLIVIILVLCVNECKGTAFKQADVTVVQQNLINCAVILPCQCLITLFLLLLIYTAGSVASLSEFKIYQYLYLTASTAYSILMLLLYVVLNKTNKNNLVKACRSLLNKNKSILNESLNASKLKLYNRSPVGELTASTDNKVININDLGVNVLSNINQEVFKVNSKYMLDYRNLQAHTNSVSTTTTSGTLENLDECEFQHNYLRHNFLMDMGVSSSNGYMSNLANTTNTESTVNESEFYSSRFDFNKPPNIKHEINDSDVIDVGQILKTRNLISVSNQLQHQQLQQGYEYDDNEDEMMPVDFANKNRNYSAHNQSIADNMMFNEKYLNFNHNEVTKCYDPDAVSHVQHNASLSLFWPKNVAECDTSYLEGSLIFTPSKKASQELQTQFSTMADKHNGGSVNINNRSNLNIKNDSYNSNSASSTSYSTSTSSLVLHSNSFEKPIMNKENFVDSENIVAILTHTGSATSSDNESGNETRV